MKRLVVAVILGCAQTLACGGSPQKPIANPDTKPAKPKEPSTAEEVIEASLAAEGGRAVLEKVTSVHMTGQVKIAQLGTPGTLETFSAPPNKAFSRFEIKGVMKDESGVTGDLA